MTVPDDNNRWFHDERRDVLDHPRGDRCRRPGVGSVACGPGNVTPTVTRRSRQPGNRRPHSIATGAPLAIAGVRVACRKSEKSQHRSLLQVPPLLLVLLPIDLAPRITAVENIQGRLVALA